MTAENPLFNLSPLPRFDLIRPEHVAPAIDALLAKARAALEEVTAPGFAASWQALSATLDVATERLSLAWGVVSHLNAVADTPQLRAAYNAALPKIAEFYTRLGCDERLYAKYKAIDANALNAEQRQALKNALRGFVLGGAELHGEAKKRFAEIQERSAELTQKFSENALDATDAFAYYASAEEMAGVPDDVKAATRAAAEAEGQSGYKLTLKLPCYLPVMQFAASSALRERLYRAYATRASDQAEGDARRFDNTAIMQEILALRHEEAQLLGYPDFGAVSLVPKMAESPEEVVRFLRELAAKARPYAERDVQDLRDYARKELGLDDPQPWDWTYLSERLREARYAFSEQQVKPYFTLPKVLAGLFRIAETLFEISIRPDQAPVWHSGVSFYRIERNGQLLGQFYLDPAARPGKRGGAWMDDARSRWLRPDTGRLQTPVAYLVCNFAEGVDGKPALLTHDDATTLFHEFGHGLHHMLTTVGEYSVAGINGVEWDAVEQPSQFMENFCYERDCLRLMTRHHETGEPLPDALYAKLIAAKNYQSAMALLRQMEFSLFDIRLHCAENTGKDALAVHRAVREHVAVTPAYADNRFPMSFQHIFAGGYAAGYYSYKWAEVLSADSFAAFEEEGVLNPATGARFRDEILAVGGSRPSMESFIAFRGRAPQVDALLRHSGIQQP